MVDHCYLCDMCYMTKCPYVPPHPWNVDFPHLMLRAKAYKFANQPVRTRDKILSSTDLVGSLAGIPVVAEAVNAVNRTADGPQAARQDARRASRKRRCRNITARPIASGTRGRQHPAPESKPAGETRGRVVLFATCYGNRNEPDLGEDLAAVFEHNGIAVTIAQRERCCGMPKLELGDLEGVARLKEQNVPELARWVDEGLGHRHAGSFLHADVQAGAAADVSGRCAGAEGARRACSTRSSISGRATRAGLLRTDFKRALGKISYHVACHLRVQNLGLKTRDVLTLVPETQVEPIERCSGHNGTYGVKREYRDVSMKIGRPVVRRVADSARRLLFERLPDGRAPDRVRPRSRGEEPTHPLKLLRMAYGI